MTIRRRYGNEPSEYDRLQRKLDQEMEMFSMACSEGDRTDAARRSKKIAELREEIASL